MGNINKEVIKCDRVYRVKILQSQFIQAKTMWTPLLPGQLWYFPDRCHYFLVRKITKRKISGDVDGVIMALNIDKFIENARLVLDLPRPLYFEEEVKKMAKDPTVVQTGKDWDCTAGDGID